MPIRGLPHKQPAAALASMNATNEARGVLESSLARIEAEERDEVRESSWRKEQAKPALVVGGAYNWRNQRERLTYLGKVGQWHQFSRVGSEIVWCEVLDEELHMLEPTVEGPRCAA